MNAVNRRLRDERRNWWYPLFASMILKYMALAKPWKMESCFGIAYLSATVFEFTSCRSIQNLGFPFCTTTTTGDATSEFDGQPRFGHSESFPVFPQHPLPLSPFPARRLRIDVPSPCFVRFLDVVGVGGNI